MTDQDAKRITLEILVKWRHHEDLCMLCFIRSIAGGIRRVSREDFIDSIISVQPMNQPSERLFYMDFCYADEQRSWFHKVWGRTKSWLQYKWRCFRIDWRLLFDPW